MKKTGDELVGAMMHIDFTTWKLEVAAQFENYKNTIDDAPNGNSWTHFLDLIAMHWGYYGDLDIHIDEFETKLNGKLRSIKNREDINVFVREIGDSKDAHDKRIKELKEHYGFISI